MRAFKLIEGVLELGKIDGKANPKAGSYTQKGYPYSLHNPYYFPIQWKHLDRSNSFENSGLLWSIYDPFLLAHFVSFTQKTTDQQPANPLDIRAILD